MNKKALSLILTSALLIITAAGCKDTGTVSQQSGASSQESSTQSENFTSTSENSSNSDNQSTDESSTSRKKFTFEDFAKENNKPDYAQYITSYSIHLNTEEEKLFESYDENGVYNALSEQELDKMLNDVFGDKIITDEAINSEISALIKKKRELNISLEACLEEELMSGGFENSGWHKANGTLLDTASMEELYELEKSLYNDITTYDDFIEKFGSAFKYENGEMYYVGNISYGLPQLKCASLNMHTMTTNRYVDYAVGVNIDGEIKAAVIDYFYPLPDDSQKIFIYYRVYLADIEKTDDGWRLVRNIDDWSKMFKPQSAAEFRYDFKEYTGADKTVPFNQFYAGYTSDEYYRVTVDEAQELVKKSCGDRLITDSGVSDKITALTKQAYSLELELLEIVSGYDFDAEGHSKEDWIEAEKQPTMFSSMEELFELEKSLYNDISDYDDFLDKFGDSFKFENNRFYFRARAQVSPCTLNEFTIYDLRDAVIDSTMPADLDGKTAAAFASIDERTPNKIRVVIKYFNLEQSGDTWKIVRSCDWNGAFGKKK